LSTATELIFGLPGETLDSWREVINTTVKYGFDSVSMSPLWLLKGSYLNQASARKDNQYVGKFMLAENAVTQYGDFISVERDEIAVQSKNYTFEEWKTVLKYQINILMTIYYGYGKELLYYANNINIKPVTLFDHLLKDPKKYPVFNEVVEGYVKTYTDNMYDTEQELYNFIKDNLEKFKKDKESLVRLGHKRSHATYLVKYIYKDPEKKYLREIGNAICEISLSKEAQEKTNFILDLSIKSIIDPFQDLFTPDIEFETKYDLNNWMLQGYSKGLDFYKLDKPKKILLKCRNSHTVRATIKKDKDQKRTDCFNFLRYMNSGLMTRFVDTRAN